MSAENRNGSGGPNPNPGGSGGNPADKNKDPKEGEGGGAGGDPDPDPEKEKGPVKYETYQKVLDEKKARDKKLADIEAELKSIKDAKANEEREAAEKKGDVQKLLELERKRAKDLEDELNNVKGVVSRGSKLSAVLDKISGNVDSRYFGLLNESLDKVVIDPSTGLPDENSAALVAQEFEANYPDVIKKGSNVKLPNDASRGGNNNLSYEQWAKLPYAERKKRMKDVLPKT